MLQGWRRSRSKLRRQIMEEITKAKDAGDQPKLEELEARLKKLEERWARGRHVAVGWAFA
jgi:hypothetical protein